MLLNPELRKTFGALWVLGDGNCLWRSVTCALWGTDEFWCQLKLVVLGWSSLNVDALVGTGGPLHYNDIHYEGHIYKKHVVRGADGKHDHRDDDYRSMLLENIAWFCKDKRWAGDLSLLLVAECLGVVTKMAIPTDMLGRKKKDAPSESPPRDTSTMDDKRYSRQYIPTGGLKGIVLRGSSGESDIAVEEIAVTVTNGEGGVVGDRALCGIPTIMADTELGTLLHYAAIVSTDPDQHVRRPLPMAEVAPPLWSKFVSFF